MITSGDDKDPYEEAVEELADANEAEELDLADDEPLPWLESSDYEEDDSVDTGRIVGFVILALLALGLVLGLFWLLTNRSVDPELVADGSTIEAPDGDFKERPDDPGGKEFDGTGDVAPAVGEGQTREGRLAEGNSASGAASAGAAGAGGESARPSVNAPSSQEATGAGASNGVGVQVGAYSTRAAAEEGWRKLTRQTNALSGFKYRIQEGTADIGTVYRLQAVAGDAGAANRLCNALKADGVACQVKR